MNAERRLLTFAILLGWCAVLLGYRFARTGETAYAFLVWNLVLATVPLGASTILVHLHWRREFPLLQWAAFTVWILFLPNAPYILTDFVHLRERPSMPLWFDIALLASGAGTGVLLAYAAAADVHAVVRDRYGRVIGWGVVVIAFLLSGFGIFLGRFLRWNSWDAVVAPRSVFHDIAVRVLDPLAHSRTIGVTIIYGVALTLGYAAVRAVRPPSKQPRGDEPSMIATSQTTPTSGQQS